MFAPVNLDPLALSGLLTMRLEENPEKTLKRESHIFNAENRSIVVCLDTIAVLVVLHRFAA
jgi:hypothetical protein